MADITAQVHAIAADSKAAAAQLRLLNRAQKDAAVLAVSSAIVAESDRILTANAADVAAARAGGIDAAIIDRLSLDPTRLQAIAAAAAEVANLPDPVGEIVRGYTLPNGLKISQVRVPLGVVGMIYEARPNVTVDAAVLCLKSGNAALLRGSGSAANTNRELVSVIQRALAGTAVPPAAVSLVPADSRDSVTVMAKARGLVDVIIPRGGAGLIRSVIAEATVPVIETGVGNCHLFVDAAADLDMAVSIALNAKTQRTTVCNTLETVLVHAAVADEFLPRLLAAYKSAGVTVHGSPAVAPFAEAAGIGFAFATDKDWAEEYYSLDIAMEVVPSIEAAVAHIAKWSTGHTEAIVTDSIEAAEFFTAAVDSAAVMVNASTRFTDGGEFGFGAEIGISTQKLHARGPMGLAELTSTKYLVVGQGHIRE